MQTPVSNPTSLPTPADLTQDSGASIFTKNAWIGRGVNLGNALEAPREGDWGMVLKEDYFELIQTTGFNSVRIPVRWNAHADTQPPYAIDPAFFDRVDWAISQALSRDLVVILNIHHYEEIFINPSEHTERFLALWSQISTHYKDYPEKLFFEPLNEPHDQLGRQSWNLLVADTISLIRQSNPERVIIIGPADWNAFSSLKFLKLPEEDQNLIVTFHYYQPFQFTHQGAEWVDGSDAWLGQNWAGTSNEKSYIQYDFSSAAQWGKENNRPIFLGEFGAYSKADIDSRARYTAAIARTAEEMGMSWAYWEFGAGFGVYDRALKQWNLPILHSLIPVD